MRFYRKGAWLLAAGLLLCTACGAAPPAPSAAPSPTATAAASPSPAPSFRRTPAGVVMLSVPDAAVMQRGKELLAEYGVGYDQKIRFPHEGQVYEAHGAQAITSLEEARSRYSDWPIPEKLGDYTFVDLTIRYERTETVSPDEVPPPKDTIEVLPDRMDEGQYYLCYQRGDTKFRINVLPLFREGEEGPQGFSFGAVSWAAHPEVRYDYYEYNNGEDIRFRILDIPPEPGGAYQFIVRKIEGDCLEDLPVEAEGDIYFTGEVPFTEEEALSIYEGIREGFADATAK